VALVGINHVALEVGSIDEALAFWERLFGPLTLRGRSRSMAFVDMGDQFVALMRAGGGAPDVHRHVGIVVDDKEAVRKTAVAAGIEVSRPPSLDVRDPWGNLIQVVDYR
jgi:catechol 2,3-dioxygenase-like lactoylglutathione lyase family enzyme